MKATARVCPDIDLVKRSINAMIKETAMGCKKGKGGGKKK